MPYIGQEDVEFARYIAPALQQPVEEYMYQEFLG